MGVTRPDPDELHPDLALAYDADRFLPAIDLLRRSGAAETQVRYDDDEEPTVWLAIIRWRIVDGLPAREGPMTTFEVAAGHDPLEAVLRLCEQVMAGGLCVHCGRRTMFIATMDTNPTPLDQLVCITEWDPELRTFRRSCE